MFGFAVRFLRLSLHVMNIIIFAHFLHASVDDVHQLVSEACLVMSLTAAQAWT